MNPRMDTPVRVAAGCLLSILTTTAGASTQHCKPVGPSVDEYGDKTRDRPALAHKDPTYLMVWRNDTSDAIWVSKAAHEGWESHHATGHDTRNGPALAADHEKFVMIWRPTDSDELVGSHSAGGIEWPAAEKMSTQYLITSTDSPSIAWNGTQFMCAWRNDERINYSTSPDGLFTGWSEPKQIPNSPSSKGPSVTALNGKFVVAWRGHDGAVKVAVEDTPGNWTPSLPIDNASTVSAPAISSHGTNGLYMAWRKGDDRFGYSCSADGHTWSDGEDVPIIHIGSGPALMANGAGIGVVTAWRGLEGNIWWTTINLSACTGDVDGDGTVDFADLLAVLAAWGPCFTCPEDLDGDAAVGFSDLLLLLSAWGPCP